jgi:hypothetical protein
MVNERLSVPPTGMVSGVFAPEMLNPDVKALTEATVHDVNKLGFVIVRVYWTVPPVPVVNPAAVLPAVPHALSVDVKLMAVTSTATDAPIKARTAITAITTTTTTAMMIQSFFLDFLGGVATGAAIGRPTIAPLAGAPHLAQKPLPAAIGLPHLGQ